MAIKILNDDSEVEIDLKDIKDINYIGDNRYSKNCVTTHDNLKVNCLKLPLLKELTDNIIQQYDSFFIDEGQFFTDLYNTVLNLVDVHKKHVIVSGLDGDCFRNPFGDIIKLIPISDTVDKLTAYCKKCNNGTIGPFSKKLNNNVNVVIDIGGNDKYIPVCRHHYFNAL